MSTSDKAVEFSDAESASDFGDECDVTELVLDATLTSDTMQDYSLRENSEKLFSEVPNLDKPNDSADKRTAPS